MVNVHITSERKGSNPGGKCVIPYNGAYLDAYIKYCSRSRLPHGHAFQPQHQPIYEALTLVLAKKFGLQIPLFFVMMNEEREVCFTHDETIPKDKRLNDNRLCFLVSKLFKSEQLDDQEALRKNL